MPNTTPLQVIAGRIDTPVLIADAQGRIAWINAAYERVTGQDADHVIGMPIPRFSNADACADASTAEQDRALEDTRSQRVHLEMVSALAGGVAHEINNALTPVMLSIDILREEAPHMQALLHDVEEGATRGANVAQALLDYSRALKADPTTPIDWRDRIKR